MAPAPQSPQKGYFITHRLTMARLSRHRNLAGGGHRFAQGWKENNWPDPDLKERFGPNTDRVELSLQLGMVPVLVTNQGSESSVKIWLKNFDGDLQFRGCFAPLSDGGMNLFDNCRCFLSFKHIALTCGE